MTRKDYKPDHADTVRRHASTDVESRLVASSWLESPIPRSENLSAVAQASGANHPEIAQWWRARLEHVLGVRSTHVRVDVDHDIVYLSGHLPRALALALRTAIDASAQSNRVYNLVEIERWSN